MVAFSEDASNNYWHNQYNEHLMPSLRITKKEVDAIPLCEHDKQQFYWDTELKGFGLCVGSTSKTFIVQKDINGRTRRMKIGKYGIWTVEQARQEARERLLQMDKGVDVVKEKRQQEASEVTLDDASKIHITALKNKNASERTIETIEGFMKTHLVPWKKRSLASITRSEVRELHTKLGKKGHYAANNTLRVFRAVYNTAMKENEFLPPNPCIAIQWFKEYRRQEPIPADKLKDWYKKVQKIPNGIRRDYQIFVLFTGLRRGDACTIEWKNINMREKSLFLPNPKGGKERAFTIPLPDVCMEILKVRKKENEILYGTQCPYLFPTKNRRGETIPLREPKEYKRGLPSPHRLRDTYTTAANSAGLSAYDIEVLTNHRPAKDSVTAGYISQDLEHLHIQQQKVADYLKGKIGLE